MTCFEEVATLKSEYRRKIEEFEKNASTIKGRDACANELYKIDMWLKKK